MKKGLSYILKTIVFFVFITLLDYIFKFDIEIMSNVCFAIGYLVFEILADTIFKKKKED